MNGALFGLIFNESDVVVLAAAQRYVDRLREPPETEWRCHEVTRAIFAALHRDHAAYMQRASIADGNGGGFDHSWIVLRPGIILDVYCAARMPLVQLVDVGTPTLQRKLYVEEPFRRDIREADLQEMIRQLAAPPVPPASPSAPR